MELANRNQTIRYRGNAQMWQGANRIMSDSIDLDRDKDNKTKRGLVAHGNVVTNFWETPKADPATANGAKSAAPAASKPAATAPVQTIVRAPNLVYTDDNRLAVYTGGVTLVRPNLREKSKELRAYMAESGADSRLEKAFADGGVEVVQTAPDHTRVGTAEHCEYLINEDRVTLRGGQPTLTDTCKGVKCGSMQAPELTYLTSDGSLLGAGAPGQIVQSRIIRKSKKK
jgi:lipopolysaccharide export system protein LptA